MRVFACAGHFGGGGVLTFQSFQIHPIEGVGMEAARPFRESPAGGGVRLRLKLGTCPARSLRTVARSRKGQGAVVIGHCPSRLRPRPTHPPGRRLGGGGGRCLPQRQTPPGVSCSVSCSFRPAPAGCPGVGAVLTAPGGYLPPECKGLGLPPGPG